MGTFIKSLCLTLLFFAYSFLLFGGGMFLEKRIVDVKQAEIEAQKEAELQREAEIKQNRTAEDFHKHYEIVVSRIKTSEIEGLDKDAIRTYMDDYQKRFDTLADLFYPDRKDPENTYGTSFPATFAAFTKAIDEAELNMYKSLITATAKAVSDEDINQIFQEI